MENLRRLCCLALLCSTSAHASLLTAWERALDHDADFQIAQADREIAGQELPLARAGLLPQLTAYGAMGRAESDVSGRGLFGVPTRSSDHYDTETWALQLRQPLFRFRNLSAYRQGKLRDASSEAALEQARQRLALRLIETVARLSAARADLQFADVELGAAKKGFEQSERQLRAGELTQTDLANATLRQVRAAERVSQAQAASAQAAAGWQQLTGEVPPATVALRSGLAQQLGGEEVPSEALLARALEQNPGLRATRRERDIAREELRKARGERLPTLDLVLSRSHVESESESTIGNTYFTNRVGLQASLPLYSGGAVSATVDKAEAGLRRAEASVLAAEAQLRNDFARELAALNLARRLAETAQASGEAARVAHRAAELGRTGGTSTLAQLGEAESAMASAARDAAHADALALISWARIRELLGELDDKTLHALNGVLTLE